MSDELPISAHHWEKIPAEIRDILRAAFAQRDAKIAELIAALNSRTEDRLSYLRYPMLGGLVTTVLYDGKGRVVRMRDCDGLTTTTTYDADSFPPDNESADSAEPDTDDPDEPFIAGN